VHAALSRAVARREIPDDVVELVLKRLTAVHTKYPIRWIDVCVYGICIDHFVQPAEFPKLVGDIVKMGPVRKLEYFPWGIIDPDIIQVHVEHRFDELAPFIEGKGLGGH
jgi:hypothetical protein